MINKKEILDFLANNKQIFEKRFYCLKIGLFPIRRHTKIKSEANPFDASFDAYFVKMDKRKSKKSIDSSSKMYNFAGKNKKEVLIKCNNNRI